MVADGRYFIYPFPGSPSSNLALDVPESNPEDHVFIIQYGWHGGPNQQWDLTHVDSGYFTIVSVATGKALDVPGGYPTPKLPIQQYRLHGGHNQQWRLETTPAFRGEDLFRPEYHRIFNRASSLAMDVPYGSLAWHVQIQQYTPNNGFNQAWLLQAVS